MWLIISSSVSQFPSPGCQIGRFKASVSFSLALPPALDPLGSKWKDVDSRLSGPIPPLPLLIAVRSTDCRLLDMVALVAAFGSSWLLVPLESSDFKMSEGHQVAPLPISSILMYAFVIWIISCHHLGHFLPVEVRLGGYCSLLGWLRRWSCSLRFLTGGTPWWQRDVKNEQNVVWPSVASPMTLTSMMWKHGKMMENVFSQQSLSGADRHCQHQQPEAHLNHIPSLVWQRMMQSQAR